MNPTDVPAYGLWPLIILNAGVFIIFAFSFTHPRTARDWRSFFPRHLRPPSQAVREMRGKTPTL